MRIGAIGTAKKTGLEPYILILLVTGTGMLAASLAWNVNQVKKSTLEEAFVEARMAYEKDLIYRRWNAKHGGVYVRVTEETPPNPNHSDLPERDITTTSGERLTLINPAYMTRQVSELMTEEFGIRGHITSLDPLRPGNRPDSWEKEALLAFEKGEGEINSVEVIEGKEYMRLMRPLTAAEECLPCHADPGYEVGQVRGGISVAIPLERLRAIEKNNVRTLVIAHILLWLVGLAGLVLGARTLTRSERERRRAEDLIRLNARQLEEANQMKDLFIDIMRHDLLNPAGVVKSYAMYLEEMETDPQKAEYCRRIEKVSDKLIKMINNASQYSKLKEMEKIECSEQPLSGIVREAIQEVADQLKALEMQVVFQPEGDFTACVSPIIGQVFSNLLTNAIKYAPDGKKIEIGITENRHNCLVYCKDFGKGISDEDKEKIFTRFERLRKEGVEGTGLGLAIAKRVVDLHQGRIWVEDNPEGGCVFYVSLPKKEPGTA